MSATPLRFVLGPNPSPMTLDGTRTFVVGIERPVVVDPGVADSRHVDAVERLLAGAAPAAILVTHAHVDHSGAAAELARRTGAPIRMGTGALQEPPFPPALYRPARNGERIAVDAGAIELIATPGHAPEHLAARWTGAGAPEGGAVFVGDLMMGEGDTALVAPPEGNLAEYLRSLAVVESLRPGVLYPAHGPPLTDPSAAIARYRAHRLRRIEQVKRALSEQPGAGAADLVHRVYGPDLPAALHPAAIGSLRAILAYLGEPDWPAGGPS